MDRVTNIKTQTSWFWVMSWLSIGILVMTWAPSTFAAVSPEEAAKLGTALTPFGAEMAGNHDGTIPPYTGGLTKPPANYKLGCGVRPDPFTGEKPFFSINAQNMNHHADKLTEGTKAMMKRHPTFRIDVYKTHRTVAYPENVLKNTAKNAVNATTASGGLSLRNARAGIPFPIAKDGFEVMWNHLLRYQGRATNVRFEAYNVDASGRIIPLSTCLIQNEYPYYDEDQTRSDADLYWKLKYLYISPPRVAGQGVLVFDSINMFEKPRIAYQYLPGQRRVKLAPEIGFDTPVSTHSGVIIYDETYLFNGSMERFDFKLIGKKEMYVPYNVYRAVYMTKSATELLGPKHLNPDMVRWELHRVWIVEGTLKLGKRHIYKKRRLYIDEDSWSALASENYDAHGNIYRVGFGFQAPSYDFPAPYVDVHVHFDLIANCYNINNWVGNGGYVKVTNLLSDRSWSPSSLAGEGIR